MHSNVPEMFIPAPGLVGTASEPLTVYMLETHGLWHIMGSRRAILQQSAVVVTFTEELGVRRRKFFLNAKKETAMGVVNLGLTVRQVRKTLAFFSDV